MSAVEGESRNLGGRQNWVKLKSYLMLIISLVAIGLTAWSALARMFVCWGHDVVSLEAVFGCHGAHWSVVGSMLLLCFLMTLLLLELAENQPARYQGRYFRTLRGAASGYQARKSRHEQIVSGMAIALFLGGILVVLIFALSDVRI